MNYDRLFLKSSGYYKEILFKDIHLVSVSVKGMEKKCEICYFKNEAAACDLLVCNGVIYKEKY